jgi:hypothetical protein
MENVFGIEAFICLFEGIISRTEIEAGLAQLNNTGKSKVLFQSVQPERQPKG